MRKAYSTDITRSQFQAIKPLLESAKKVTAPRKYDLYDIFCAIAYVVKYDCPWNEIPHDFPKWQSVFYYFQQWSKPKRKGASLLEQAQKKSREVQQSEIREARKAKLGHN